MTPQEEIFGILDACKAQIQANMDAAGINASGRTKQSFAVEQYDGGVRLVGGGTGAAPVQTLEIGREGGKVPVGFYKIIKQWTIDKGITFNTESERGTFSYFVAQKIAREGTKRHKEPLNIYSEPVNEAMRRLSLSINTMYSREISKVITRNF